jgi:hypothetical protein
MRTFIAWMEDNSTKRDLVHQLARDAGLAKTALDHGNDVPLKIVDPRLLKASIESLPVSGEEKQKLLKMAQNNPDGGTLGQIANAINPLAAKRQDKKISQPAQLPPGQGQVPPPGQPNQQMQQQQQQPMG